MRSREIKTSYHRVHGANTEDDQPVDRETESRKSRILARMSETPLLSSRGEQHLELTFKISERRFQFPLLAGFFTGSKKPSTGC